jgi:hypothetical protein
MAAAGAVATLAAIIAATIGQAVAQYLQTHPVEWHDREDEVD